MNWYLEALGNYADFSDRARRMEYWSFTLVNFLIGFALAMLRFRGSGFIGVIALVYSLAMIIPSLSVTVRRLHDTDRSGWWLLIALIPLIGELVLLVFMFLEGTPGPNRYGPDPKGRLA
jgi:uncharacterized membrane protein YhaH (DUF805 family)